MEEPLAADLFDPQDPLGDGLSSAQLIQQVGNDQMICAAARVSLAGDLHIRPEEDNYKLIRYLIKHQHGTPFEHNLITFRITAPLYVIQEMLRHRVGVSFNQESGRYIKIKNQAYIPLEFRGQSKSNRQASVPATNLNQADISAQYKQAIDLAYTAYEALLEAGVCREQARGILPHATYSSLYVTFNVRSLMHFLGLRLSPDAQYEIRQYARAFKLIAEPLFPLTFRALTELTAP